MQARTDPKIYGGLEQANYATLLHYVYTFALLKFICTIQYRTIFRASLRQKPVFQLEEISKFFF